MQTPSLEILEKAQLPPAQARAILKVMETEFATEALATKNDLSVLRAELIANFATKADLSDLKADLMKWMVVFWVGQIGATLAIVRYLK